MKKKILFFEPNETLRGALVEKLETNKDFEVIQVSNLDAIPFEIKKLPFDLLIIGLDRGTFSLSSIKKFILEMQIVNKVLFVGDLKSFLFALICQLEPIILVQRQFRSQ